MALETSLTYFLGTDHQFVHSILDSAQAVAIDISGWELSFMIKRSRSQPDANASLTKTTSSGIAITGAFNVDPDTNTQVATVSIDDTDTDALAAGSYVWELKRTDAGLEAVIGYGPIRMIRSVHRT
jgi:hypothetical protein